MRITLPICPVSKAPHYSIYLLYKCCVGSDEIKDAKASKEDVKAQAIAKQQGRLQIAQENAENRRVARRNERLSLREAKQSLKEQQDYKLQAQLQMNKEKAMQNQAMARQVIASDEKARALQFEREQREFVAYQKAKEEGATHAHNVKIQLEKSWVAFSSNTLLRKSTESTCERQAYEFLHHKSRIDTSSVTVFLFQTCKHRALLHCSIYVRTHTAIRLHWCSAEIFQVDNVSFGTFHNDTLSTWKK